MRSREDWRRYIDEEIPRQNLASRVRPLQKRPKDRLEHLPPPASQVLVRVPDEAERPVLVDPSQYFAPLKVRPDPVPQREAPSAAEDEGVARARPFERPIDRTPA